VDWRDQVVVLGNAGHQQAEEPRERNGDCRNRAGLDDQEERPAVEKAPERRERLAQVNVLAARPRHHGGQLAVRQRRRQRQQPRDEPRGEQPSRAAHLPSDVGRDEEDARPDHRPDNDHRRVEQTEPAFELGVQALRGVVQRLRRCGHPASRLRNHD
jgi:hypothetical protein